jgi:excisionase family DNA binding protein
MSEILNLDEACLLLRVAKPTLYRYIRRGQIPAFKIGRNWKFQRAALDDWIKVQMQENYQNRNMDYSMAAAMKDDK